MMIQPSSRLASVATARLRSTPCHRRRDTSTAATTVSNDTRILATQKWLDNIVIGQKLCPFAPSVRSAPQLRLRVSSSVNEDTLVKEVAVEARILVGKDNRSEKYHPRPETTLLVLNEDIYPEMSDFRNLVKASWRLRWSTMDLPLICRLYSSTPSPSTIPTRIQMIVQILLYARRMQWSIYYGKPMY